MLCSSKSNSKFRTKIKSVWYLKKLNKAVYFSINNVVSQNLLKHWFKPKLNQNYKAIEWRLIVHWIKSNGCSKRICCKRSVQLPEEFINDIQWYRTCGEKLIKCVPSLVKLWRKSKSSPYWNIYTLTTFPKTEPSITKQRKRKDLPTTKATLSAKVNLWLSNKDMRTNWCILTTM